VSLGGVTLCVEVIGTYVVLTAWCHIIIIISASGLDAGTCFVNTYNKTDVAAPFGGFKQSGFGKDLGKFQTGRLKYNSVFHKGSTEDVARQFLRFKAIPK